MPTGYTEIITRKPDLTFEEFVLRCCRNFGVCISMQDVSLDILPTKENIKSNNDESYYKNRIDETEKELKEFQSINWKNSVWQESIIKEKERDLSIYKERIQEKQKDQKLYERMLKKVNAWTPPTDNHNELKTFMIKQIQESIKYDCDTSYYDTEILKIQNELDIGIDFERLYFMQLDSYKKSHDYHTKQLNKICNQDDSRIKWMEDLCKSLGIEW